MPVEAPLERLCAKILRECTALAKGETCLLVTDLEPSELQRALAAAIPVCGGLPLVLGLPEEVYLREPLPKAVEAALTSADVVLIHTRRIFPQGPRRLAAEAGARVLSLCTVTTEMALRALDVDYTELSRITRGLAEAFIEAAEVLMTSRKGTELRVRVEGQPVAYLDGLAREPGRTSALPAGVVAALPLPEMAEGRIVLTGSLASIGLLKDTITLTVKRGRVTDIRGGREAERLRELLETADENARCVAEIGLGTNPKAAYTGNLVEDERVSGSGHIGLGRNTHLGGTISSFLHLDGTLREPTVYLDGELIVNEGKLVNVS
ncbi:MAG: aminopeptidase [Candidatus Methanosuratincola sp.]|jgi:leucyl aminopeptidase (aminopeptidase T)